MRRKYRSFENNSSSATNDYINCLISNNFLPSLLLPTRITCHSSTLIDHIYFFNNSPNNTPTVHCGNLLSDISDHLPNFFLIKFQKYLDMSNRPTTRVFSSRNKSLFNENISSIMWSEMIDSNSDVNVCYDTFINKLSEIYNQCFPLVKISRRAYKNKSWFNTDLRKELNEKNRLYKVWLESANDRDKIVYINFKKNIQ